MLQRNSKKTRRKIDTAKKLSQEHSTTSTAKMQKQKSLIMAKAIARILLRSTLGMWQQYVGMVLKVWGPVPPCWVTAVGTWLLSHQEGSARRESRVDNIKRESGITRGHASPNVPHIDSKTNKTTQPMCSKWNHFVDSSEDSRKMGWLWITLPFNNRHSVLYEGRHHVQPRSSSQITDGTQELSKDHAFLNKDHSRDSLSGGHGAHLIFQGWEWDVLISFNLLAFGVQHGLWVSSCNIYPKCSDPPNGFLMENSRQIKYWWARRDSEWFNALINSRLVLNSLSLM